MLEISYLDKHPKFQTKRFYRGVIPPNDGNGMASSEEHDYTVPIGAF